MVKSSVRHRQWRGIYDSFFPLLVSHQRLPQKLSDNRFILKKDNLLEQKLALPLLVSLRATQNK